MKSVEQLNEIASRRLGGLEADGVLWQKITLEATERRRPVAKHVLAFAGACAVAAGALFFVLKGGMPVNVNSPEKLVETLPAGGTEQSAPLTREDAPLSMSAAPGEKGVYSTSGEEGILMLSGAAYRLTDEVVPAELLGEEIGAVTEFTLQPALSDGDAVSSVIPNGGRVCAVKQAPGAAAAEVDGQTRLFERVGYLNRALRAGETLQDTLCRAEDVASLSLAGRVWEGEAARELVRVLLETAEYLNAGGGMGDTLTITLNNGLTLRYAAADDTLYGCGSWYCPEFFRAMSE